MPVVMTVLSLTEGFVRSFASTKHSLAGGRISRLRTLGGGVRLALCDVLVARKAQLCTHYHKTFGVFQPFSQ